MIKTCIMCPMGCTLNITKKNNIVEVVGNKCPRGKEFGISQLTNPMRSLSSLVKTTIGTVIPCKTSTLIPQNKIEDVLNEIRKLNISKVKFGDVLIANVCNTSANIIALDDFS